MQLHQKQYNSHNPHDPGLRQTQPRNLYDDDGFYDSGAVRQSSQLKQNPADLPPLLDDQLLLCVSQVHGFLLKNKEWGKF